MRIAQINMFPNGSTGSIMLRIAEQARIRGHIVKTYSAASIDNKTDSFVGDDHFVFGSYAENKLHVYLGVATGRNGFFSFVGTRQLIKDLEKFDPEIIHLHNLHRFCIDLPMLFRYIRRKNIRVIWTLHDCWTFTGKCPHFEMAQCDKWLSGCGDCPSLGDYPKSMVDSTRAMYRRKKEMFTSVSDMTIVTPSRWLAEQVSKSFLNKYDTKVIYNGIDTEIFKPMDSDFRKSISCEDKIILLCVAFDWSERKGLDVFNTLAEELDDRYRIVLVGVSERATQSISSKIIIVPRTENQRQLAEIYSAADIFVNPTREEVLGLVNLEALACGTPVITFKTGGSPETINEKCGAVVEKNDVSALKEKIELVATTRPFMAEDCVQRASEFNKSDKFKEYVDLYEDSTHSPHVTL